MSGADTPFAHCADYAPASKGVGRCLLRERNWSQGMAAPPEHCIGCPESAMTSGMYRHLVGKWTEEDAKKAALQGWALSVSIAKGTAVIRRHTKPPKRDGRHRPTVFNSDEAARKFVDRQIENGDVTCARALVTIAWWIMGEADRVRAKVFKLNAEMNANRRWP